MRTYFGDNGGFNNRSPYAHRYDTHIECDDECGGACGLQLVTW